MPRRRGPNWSRGRLRSEPQPIRADASDTTDFDFTGARTVDPTWDPTAAASGASFQSLGDRGVPRRSWPISSGGVSATIAAIVLFGGIILYVAAIKTDVTVVTTRLNDLRDEFRRLDDRVRDFLQGRRQPEPPAPARKPEKR